MSQKKLIPVARVAYLVTDGDPPTSAFAIRRWAKRNGALETDENGRQGIAPAVVEQMSQAYRLTGYFGRLHRSKAGSA